MGMTAAYGDTRLFIGGAWQAGRAGEIAVVNPATEETIGHVARASRGDLEDAVAAAKPGFSAWREVSTFDRCLILREAAKRLRADAEATAELMSLEQGKPVTQAKGEVLAGADIIDWFAEEGRRTYGQVVPSRHPSVTQIVVKEPVGIVAAFTPWNFPVNQAVRKISAALAAGCSVILKGPEETPASVAALVRAFVEAGLPAGALNLVFGAPAEISAYLIAHPDVRKISFTGSTAVGKQLAALAGQHMKRITMELGGHAPAIVFADADVVQAATILATQKFRNAGQICVAPTRFLVHKDIFDAFTDSFVEKARSLKVGPGNDPSSQLGPLANERRLTAMQTLVDDAVGKGARRLTGGKRLGNRGYFFEATVLADVPLTAVAMNEEPFGPIALINRFSDPEDAIEEANRLPFGLAAYAYTRSRETIRKISGAIEAGMLSINHHGLGLPELPFGGIKDSGYGTEGGSAALDAYLNAKLITQA
jgi:succinate-semialdehyde dehydrogenase/glutarate-semialdehyde dehydrogenase